eukprot:scaffold174157_cov29-Tisochrysis_lutea.AAC.1
MRDDGVPVHHAVDDVDLGECSERRREGDGRGGKNAQKLLRTSRGNVVLSCPQGSCGRGGQLHAEAISSEAQGSHTLRR